MIRVMLVDDEPFIRVAIKTLFPWEEHGYQIVSEANNGEAALLKLEYENIDLIITDIRMPVTDGITLIHQVRQKYPHIVCVVLSNYEDFSLTRAAFRAGAADYLLKGNLNNESFSSLISHLQNSSLIQGTPASAQASPAPLGTPEAPDWALQQLITDHAVSEELIRQLDFGLPYVISSIRLGEWHKKTDETSATSVNRNLIMNTVLEIISMISEFKIYSYAVSAREYILLICNEESDNELFHRKLTAFFNSLSANIQSYINTFAVIGTSPVYTDVNEILNAYRNADSQSNRIFYLNESSLFFGIGKADEVKKVKDYVRTNVGSVSFFIREQNWQAIRDFFHTLLDLLRTALYPVSDAKHLLCNLEFLISNEIAQVFRNESFVHLDNTFYGPTDVAQNFSELQDSVEQFLENLKELSHHTLAIRKDYSDITNNALSYLDEHYRDPDISLESVANAIAVNSSYLSRLFHKETKMNFNAYLTSLRINYSKICLRSTRDSIAGIAIKCGYNDPKYFINIFKKTTGLTPSAYRNQNPDEETL